MPMRCRFVTRTSVRRHYDNVTTGNSLSMSMTPKRRRTDTDKTFWRRIDFGATSIRSHVLTGNPREKMNRPMQGGASYWFVPLNLPGNLSMKTGRKKKLISLWCWGEIKIRTMIHVIQQLLLLQSNFTSSNTFGTMKIFLFESRVVWAIEGLL